MSHLGIHTRAGKVLAVSAATMLVAASAVVAANSQTPSVPLGALPNPQLTPGQHDRLAPGYLCTHSTSARRHVGVLTKIAVFKIYRVPLPAKSQRANWEIDHLIPLALGGTNDISNLWPEQAPGFHRKDALEMRLRTLVCNHRLDLAAAQRAIATDWTAAYRKYVTDRVVETGDPVD